MRGGAGVLYVRHTHRQIVEAEGESTRLDAALRASEERYRSLFDHIPVGMYRTASDGRVLLANATLARLIGAPSPEAARAYNASDFYVDRADRDRFRETILRDGFVRASRPGGAGRAATSATSASTRAWRSTPTASRCSTRAPSRTSRPSARPASRSAAARPASGRSSSARPTSSSWPTGPTGSPTSARPSGRSWGTRRTPCTDAAARRWSTPRTGTRAAVFLDRGPRRRPPRPRSSSGSATSTATTCSSRASRRRSTTTRPWTGSCSTCAT